MALTVKRVQKLMRRGVPGRHTDTEVRGLLLCVENRNSAHWVLRYQRHHKTTWLGLGSARDVPLAAARAKARRERERLADGIDPLAVKHAERAAQRQAEAKRPPTFREAAERCHSSLSAGWSNDRHRDEFISSLQRWAFPLLGDLPVSEVDRDAVLRCLEQKLPDGGTFWERKAITADRTRARVETVLDWAEARGHRPGLPNPARWRNGLDQLLPAPRKVAPVQRMRAVPYAQLPGVMQFLAAEDTVASAALRFIILTAARMGEALGATWQEIDLATGEWTIPAQRMKNRREHRVPLSPQALALLRSLPVEDGTDRLFISGRRAGAISDVTVTAALRRAGRPENVHGFRSSFRDWAAERTNLPAIIAELALAHSPGSAVEKAYRRSDLIVKRKRLMDMWGAFVCTPPAAANVVPMRGAGAKT
jgi:integrase